MIKEVKRMLKTNGIAYISTVFKKWYGWYFYKCNGKWVLDPTHLREYSQDNQLLDFFKENNLEILENKKTLTYRPIVDFVSKRIGLKRYLPVDGKFMKLLRKFAIPVFGYYNWEIVCRKK